MLFVKYFESFSV